MTNPNTYDDNTNPDLPGEIHDEYDYNTTFPCGFYQDRWWDWNDDIIGPNADEPVWDDDEDDSWTDADSLASAGWGTDEDYGLFDEGGW